MKIFIPLLIISILGSCSSRVYTYSIVLEKPQKSNNLNFENDTMSISFDFIEKGITFKLYNKTEDGIKINWDELSMSVNGKAQRVLHKETGSYKITDVQPPTTIPPKTVLEDGIIPSDIVSYSNIGGRTIINLNALYPKYDYGDKRKRAEIMNMKGQKIVIFLPYYIRNIYHSKIFEFLITDIIAKKG